MAAGFKDLFAWLLGWKSSATAGGLVEPDTIGAEWIMPTTRGHFVQPRNVGHFVRMGEKAHFAIPKED